MLREQGRPRLLDTVAGAIATRVGDKAAGKVTEIEMEEAARVRDGLQSRLVLVVFVLLLEVGHEALLQECPDVGRLLIEPADAGVEHDGAGDLHAPLELLGGRLLRLVRLEGSVLDVLRLVLLLFLLLLLLAVLMVIPIFAIRIGERRG